MPKISIRLSPRDIDRAIREVQEYRRTLDIRLNALVERLTELGVEIAKMQVRELGAVYTAELEESIEGLFNPATGVGIVRAGAPYAVYVEFGTGIVGKASPHPVPEGWVYDVNDRGESGWWYFNDRDRKWHWTQGMASRPFMYNTARELESRVEQVAREVFGS